jgi:tRNA-Thr(GGU) m(6)t(6)A37 methyltransferase TsaA
MTKETGKMETRTTEIKYRPIGIIHSEYTNQEETPIQGIFNSSSKGEVELFPEYVSGLEDLESFSHIILLYHFHRATGCTLLQKPFLDGEKERGIFAIRHFNRPNPIGISIVELKAVRGNVLEVSGIDVLDGTPLLDIKPYVRQFDHREEAKSGWVDDQHIQDIEDWNSTPKELRKRERTNV